MDNGCTAQSLLSEHKDLTAFTPCKGWIVPDVRAILRMFAPTFHRHFPSTSCSSEWSVAWCVSYLEGQSAASYSTDGPQVLASSGMHTTAWRDKGQHKNARDQAQAWFTSKMSIYFMMIIHIIKSKTGLHAEGWVRDWNGTCHTHLGQMAYSETPLLAAAKVLLIYKGKNLTLCIQILPLKRKDYHTCHLSGL